MLLTRRDFPIAVALAALAAGLGGRARAQEWPKTLERALAAIETGGGRLGVAILDTSNGEVVGLRADERFPLCSTSKALITAAVLAGVDASRLALDDRIAITPTDLLSYAPVTKTHVGGELSLADLCAAAIEVSDNTAANLLIGRLGGPAAVTAFVRSLGDETTRLDRTEPSLNEANPGDPRDTTTPAAMARTLARIAAGDALHPASRELWAGWLIDCKTGLAKLRSGLPGNWRVGDKTGSGGHGANNDVAIVWPPGRAPFVVASYLAETDAPDAAKNAVHAAVGRALAAALGG
jgi:beta-lactamase class A